MMDWMVSKKLLYKAEYEDINSKEDLPDLTVEINSIRKSNKSIENMNINIKNLIFNGRLFKKEIGK